MPTEHPALEEIEAALRAYRVAPGVFASLSALRRDVEALHGRSTEHLAFARFVRKKLFEHTARVCSAAAHAEQDLESALAPFTQDKEEK